MPTVRSPPPIRADDASWSHLPSNPHRARRNPDDGQKKVRRQLRQKTAEATKTVTYTIGVPVMKQVRFERVPRFKNVEVEEEWSVAGGMRAINKASDGAEVVGLDFATTVGTQRTSRLSDCTVGKC